ncbi:hypothetical protein NLI96_g5104 [Meripilus lineatus]|uniref:Uncharacterized protein n=1 Tax=Meripilus lineatus TaxID=2056292 RepID=A0AAD5V5J3_9APHY|nr:hypothetical protein NLI96_g5104 [Physisporinus lineatus]
MSVTPITDSKLERREHIIAAYPDAFTDTYGTISCSPFLYKTGSSWPSPALGPEMQPFLRRLYPVYNHPITDSWPVILKSIQAYLSECNMQFTAIMGLGWGNQNDEIPFCPLLITIGVEPQSVSSGDAKGAAEHIKNNILNGAGFLGIDVAIWELQTSLSAGPRLRSLEPLEFKRDNAKYAHPFSSTLSLSIAPLKNPNYEGTASLFLRRDNSKHILVLTAAHVIFPDSEPGDNHNLQDEKVVILGEGDYMKATNSVNDEIGKLERWISKDSKKEKEYVDNEVGQSEERIALLLSRKREELRVSKEDAADLKRIRDEVVQRILPDINNRVIGHVLHADPIGVRGTESGPFTNDWAIIELNNDAFDDSDFEGNKVYIGDISEGEFEEKMYPLDSERTRDMYPEDLLLPISGSVPRSEILNPTQHNKNGDPAMPVIKNGSTTGTTIGWLNGLESLVTRRYGLNGQHTFTSTETTVVPYGGSRLGAFSEDGDSGSLILDRKGRIVGLLTGGGGLTNRTDVTFATAWYALEPHIRDTLPGIDLY